MLHTPFRHRRTMFAVLVAIFAHGTTAAEEVTLPDITVAEPPLTDDYIPNAVHVDNTGLQALRPATSDSASLLKNIPGLDIQGAGPVSGLPVLHGLADDRLRIKVDGMDLISACGNHMNPPLSYIDPSSVDEAKVYAGITPVSLGGDSIGSTIQVDSAGPKFAKPGEPLLYTGEAGSFYRSNGDAHGVNAAVTLASETLSLSYRGATAEANDYRAGDDFKPAGPAAAGRGWLDSDEVGSTMYKSTNHLLGVGMRQENHLVEMKFGLQDIPYQGYPNQRMDMTGNDSKQANLRYKGEYGWGDLEARAYRENTRHKMQFFSDKLYWYGGGTVADGDPSCIPSGGNAGCAAGMPMDTEGVNNGVTIKAELPLSARDLLRIGSEAQQYRLDDWWDPAGKGMWPETFWNIHDGERDRLALFGEWEAQWSAAWLTQIGVRGEQVRMNAGEVQGYATSTSIAPWNTMIAPKYTFEADAFNSAERQKTDNNLDLTTLARFTPNKMRTVEFGYSRKSRSPNLYERYTWSTNGMSMRMINMTGDGNGYVGDLELDPEISHTVSATLDWHDAAAKKWSIVASPYFTYVSDYIDARRCSSADVVAGTTSSACTDANLTAVDSFVYLKYVNQSARIYGMDISGHYPLAERTAYGSFSASGKVSYVRGKNGSTDDNLYNMMPLNARLALKQKTGNWTNTIESELVDAKDKVSATRNEMETAGYGLLHLRSSYEWKQARFDVGIENVLDRFYNHPLGGAYLGQGKTMSGTDVPWGTPVPGMGRSIYAGVNVRF